MNEKELAEKIKFDGRYSVPVQSGDALDYQQRETLKREASAVMNSDATLHARSWAALHFIEAHYWRALECLEDSSRTLQKKVYGINYGTGYELDIDVYTRHWLHANGDKLSDAITGYLKEVFYYEAVESKYLPRGASIYREPEMQT